MQDPNGIRKIEEYLNKVKPEAAYFFEDWGDRTFLLVVDVPSADMIPVIAEPLFQGFNAKVEFHPAMVLADLKKAAEKVERLVSPLEGRGKGR
jgi:hypothetical protein